MGRMFSSLPMRLLLIVFIVVILFSLFNDWLMRNFKERPAAPAAITTEAPAAVKPQPKPLPQGKTTRRTYLHPNRTYEENAFLINGQEVTTCKSSGFKLFDCTAPVPDGPCTFENTTNGAKGEERWEDGLRHGTYKEYYPDGAVKLTMEFFHGNLISSKEFFSDGIIKMEQDLSDALWSFQGKETGVGKVYYRNGTPMFEWSLTNKGQGGFKKSYNTDGSLRSVMYYNASGDLIRSERFEPPAPESEPEPGSTPAPGATGKALSLRRGDRHFEG